MTIIERIQTFAQDKGIKQNVLAETCGVSAATISGWIKLNVDSIPSACVVPLAGLLGCSPLEILTGEKYATDDKDTDTQRLLDIFSALDWEGKQMVMAAAIAEDRRLEAALSRARARTTSVASI